MLLDLQRRFTDWLVQEERPRWVHFPFALFALISILLLMGTAAWRPLQFEEIVTYWVAKSAKDLPSLYDSLLKHLDNHPPLDYSLRHLSMRVFGDGALAFRLPSIVGFGLGLVGIYAIVIRFLPVACAVGAAALFAASQANAVGQYGRSYGILLGVCVGALWMWRVWADERKAWALTALALFMASAPMLHYYGPLHLFAVVVAELARTYQRRKVDWLVWGAFLATFACLPLVYPLAADAKKYSRGFWTPVSIDACLSIYKDLFAYLAAPLVFMLAVVVILRFWWPGNTAKFQLDRKAAPEIVASLWLVLLPVVVFLAAKFVTGALFFRYAVSLIGGVCVLFGFSLRGSRYSRAAAILILPLFAVGMIGAKAVGFARHFDPGPVAGSIEQIAKTTDLPLVLDSPQAFLETWHYASPEIRNRLYYLVDEEAAFRIQGQNVDQRFLLIFGERIGPHAVPRVDFLKVHPRFCLVFEGGWLLKSIGEEVKSVSVRYLGRQALIDVSVDPTTVP